MLNIPVEAELGRVGGKEDEAESGQGSAYIDPGEAEEFAAVLSHSALQSSAELMLQRLNSMYI